MKHIIWQTFWSTFSNISFSNYGKTENTSSGVISVLFEDTDDGGTMVKVGEDDFRIYRMHNEVVRSELKVSPELLWQSVLGLSEVRPSQTQNENVDYTQQVPGWGIRTHDLSVRLPPSDKPTFQNRRIQLIYHSHTVMDTWPKYHSIVMHRSNGALDAYNRKFYCTCLMWESRSSSKISHEHHTATVWLLTHVRPAD